MNASTVRTGGPWGPVMCFNHEGNAGEEFITSLSSLDFASFTMTPFICKI